MSLQGGDQPPLMVPNGVPSTEDATEVYSGSLQTDYPDWYIEISLNFDS